MGRLGDWDRVEKKSKPIKFSREDEIWEYVKLSVWVIGAGFYFYFLFF